EGVVFALLGFINPERSTLRFQALEIGAEYQADWNSKCTLLERVVFALSGFINPERGTLKSQALQMGAEYQADWNSKCTLLICAFCNTQSFDTLRLIMEPLFQRFNFDWITECYNQKKLVGVEPYLLHAGKPLKHQSNSTGPSQGVFIKSKNSNKQAENPAESKPRASSSSKMAHKPAKNEFSTSEVKKWAIDDMNKTMSRLDSQEEKDAIDFLKGEFKPETKTSTLSPNDDEEGSSGKDGRVYQSMTDVDIDQPRHGDTHPVTPLGEQNNSKGNVGLNDETLKVLMQNILPSVSEEGSLRRSQRTSKFLAKLNEIVLDNKVKYGLNRNLNAEVYMVPLLGFSEAEYRVMASVTCKVMWFVKILKDFNIESVIPASLICDNKFAIQIAANLVMHEKTKQFDIDVHLVREKIASGLIKTIKVESKYHVVDILTKSFDMDLFSLIRAPNPTKLKTGSHPRAVYEVPLLIVTANRVIEVEDLTAATGSSGVPSTIKRSPLDFANEAGPKDQETMAPKVSLPEDVPTTRGAPEAGPTERVAATDPPAIKEFRKRGHDGDDANTPPKVLRRDHADPRPTGSTRGRKSLAAIELSMGSARLTPVPQSVPHVSDPDPLSFADPRSRPPTNVAQSSKGATAAGDPKSENTSFASMVRSPESIYRPEWGIPNGNTLDTPKTCQDLVDHIAPSGYFLELRHLHNDDFLRHYNVNLARQVAIGSQLRLRFEQEAKLLKKSVAQVARRDKRIQARENEIKNLEALLEAEADIKKVAEDKSVKLSQELEDMRALFSDLQVSNDHLSQQVSTLQEQRCAKMDGRLDALSIDFNKELYPHMLTAIAGRRWMIGCGLRLAVMKCGESIELRQVFVDVVSAGIDKGMSEGLKYRVEHGQAQLNLEDIEAYDPSSQLTIPVYPEVREPMDPWACKEEMLLADAIAANVSHAEKKKKCRVVCRTHGVGSAHHARSDGVPVSVPTVVPQGLAILLADAATQTETSDEASPQLLRSSSLPVIHS
nr:DNA-repair protein XRCC1 [Tanacetum cinerariifolium]